MKDQVHFDEDVWRGIELINRGQYFRAHEVLELVWFKDQSSFRRLYQGLIQTSVCLYHLKRGNLPGAVKLAAKARENILPYLDIFLPIDCSDLLNFLDLIAHSGDDNEHNSYLISQFAIKHTKYSDTTLILD